MTEDKKAKKSLIAEREEIILDFWERKNIFQKSVLKDAPLGEFVFYDGPPFASGLPHYGHILAGTIKDVIPRYKTMRGFRVRRQWGWDCHGLPVENLVEKELGLTSKRDIEQFGLEKFNQVARESVMRFASDWQKIIPRLGRFVDMEKDYRTMDSSYTESVWWVFKTLYDKRLIYQGQKSMHLCPHCGTTLSNFEVSQGYKDITDISVYAKFELADEPGVYLVAWTTTPWTLPGNVALAVNPDITYVKVYISSGKEQGHFIFAKDRIEQGMKGIEYDIEAEIKGKDLIGRSYKPLFPYYAEDPKLENLERGWKIYGADFVTTEEGTGIVHIAPAFGEDDMKLGQEKKLPFVQHVGMDGKFKKEVTDFAGQDAKPKDDPSKTDIEIIKNLAHQGLLFAKEKITHSYPHCWRCDTPLLNYASSSWFVRVTAFKDKLVAANKKVSWVPKDVKEGRFGNWLLGARDWAISRTRFWGAPLPVWKCEACKKEKIIGSVADLKSASKRRNTYYLMRHGQAEQNIKCILSSDSDDPYHLTEKGKKDAAYSAKEIQGKGIDLIFASDFVRTRETAEIVADTIGLSRDKIYFDPRLHEINVGVFDEKPFHEYHEFFSSRAERFTKAPKGGETARDVKRRTTEFLYEIDRKYEGKTILIVGHDDPLFFMQCGGRGLTPKEIIALPEEDGDAFELGQIKKFDFIPLPHNAEYELDLHRPFIDGVTFSCECGGAYKRISDVFDCWFESGSVPYGSNHYPFENLDTFDPRSGLFRRAKGFPADFIAEGLDQTRGWFYSMIVLGVALFGRSPYRNVIVNGTVLAEDGQKMAKRLQNYPDPMEVVNRYGADALRFYLLSTPAMRAEDIRFSEKGVDEVVKKTITRLNNVYAFFEMYSGNLNPKLFSPERANHVLDLWILVRLNQLIEEVTKHLEAYALDAAARPIALFVDDLSTWYLRRSRERFKGDDAEDREFALQTTRYVLLEFSKIIAPFMPFLAEDLYEKVKPFVADKETEESDCEESVHLESWPEPCQLKVESGKLLEEMEEVRRIVSLALEARARANIKVRQPLGKLKIKNQKSKFGDQLLDLIKDEVNVKEVVFDEKLETEVALDTVLTPELKKEGQARELIRNIQDLRKEMNLVPTDSVFLSVTTSREGENLLKSFDSEIRRVTLVEKIRFVDALADGKEVQVDDMKFSLKLSK